MMNIIFTLTISLLFAQPLPKTKEITTNEISIPNAPDWLKQTRVEKVTAHILNRLEWTVHRFPLHFHYSHDTYSKAQSLGPLALAVTVIDGRTATVHMGPDVDTKNFDEVLGHELVHVILFQKYKGVVPKWLEEGVANLYSGKRKVNYAALAQNMPADVRELGHPFTGSAASISGRYIASQAFAEMLDKKCDLDNLLRISVERKLEDYIVRTCEIKDLNAAFKEWVKKKAGVLESK